jgi:hypothetical protein
MKKMIFVMLSLVIISMFLIGCTEKKVSDAELEAQLSELSDTELNQVIQTVEAEDTGALVGQAHWKKIPKKIPRNTPKDKFLKMAYKVKTNRIENPPEEPCPEGQIRYYLAEWDKKGYCGIQNNDYCLEHFVYVPEPSGSLGMGSECTMVWMCEEEPCPNAASGPIDDIIGGYACSRDNSDPIFMNPPPENACPVGTYLSLNEAANNQLQYNCVAECNQGLIEPTCPNNYEVVATVPWSDVCPQNNNYVFTCSLGGFKYSWQYPLEEDGSAPLPPCGSSGAQAIGGGYCCAYTE